VCSPGAAGGVSTEWSVPSPQMNAGAIPKKRNDTALAIAIAAWLVPGAGHLLVGRRARALAIFVAVGGLAITGYFLRGNVFSHRPGDAFGLLGFLADVGSGVFYGLARFLERRGPDVSRAAGDYGTRFVAAAGIVNVLAMLDAYEIALRRRS
jgi:hypothetical protein